MGRFLSLDPLGFDSGDYNLYRYALNNPTNLTDPTGEFPILAFLVKAGTEALVDALMQATINYYFDPSVTTIGQAFESIDLGQVGLAFVTGLLPGGDVFKSAVGAVGGVLLNYIEALENCEEYTPEQALRDFTVGFTIELIGSVVGDSVAKYGVPAVAAGLRRLGFDDLAERLLRNTDETLDELADGKPKDGPDGSFCSFRVDTPVMTDEGFVLIGELQEGDYVLAFNEATGEIGYYPVLAVWAHEDSVIQYLTIDGEVIVTTPNHPFKTGTGAWLPAGELQVGDTIDTAQGGTGIVEAISFVYAPQPMYNLTVATAHTYFVGDGQWLVHNSCLERIQKGVANTISPYLSDIRRLAPDAQVGFRGSLARGTKGPHKGNAPFDPSNFDIDAFIVSDELAARFPSREWFRSGNKIPELANIQQKIGTSLRSQFSGLRNEPFTFRIFTTDEFLRKVKPDERFFINP